VGTMSTSRRSSSASEGRPYRAPSIDRHANEDEDGTAPDRDRPRLRSEAGPDQVVLVDEARLGGVALGPGQEGGAETERPGPGAVGDDEPPAGPEDAANLRPGAADVGRREGQHDGVEGA